MASTTTVKVRKATKQAVNRRKGIHLSTLRVAAYESYFGGFWNGYRSIDRKKLLM